MYFILSNNFDLLYHNHVSL